MCVGCSSSMLTIEEGALWQGGTSYALLGMLITPPWATRPAESMDRFDLHRADAIPLCMCMFSVVRFIVCESVSMALTLIALVAWLVWMDPTDRQITTFTTYGENAPCLRVYNILRSPPCARNLAAPR